jgi:hypothetical protein
LKSAQAHPKPAMANPNRFEGHIFEKIFMLRAKIWSFPKDFVDFLQNSDISGILEGLH